MLRCRVTHEEEVQLREAVASTVSLSASLRKLGRARVGSNHKWIKKHIARLGLDTSHWRGMAHGTSRTGGPLSEILVENSSYTNLVRLKKRLVSEGLIEFACAECGISEWMGKPLVLQLDHVNGVRDDNRIGNLRLLCPNCHSQTPTYCGRNKKLP